MGFGAVYRRLLVSTSAFTLIASVLTIPYIIVFVRGSLSADYQRVILAIIPLLLYRYGGVKLGLHRRVQQGAETPYQVPLALAERRLLDRFVTDYYDGVSRIRVPTLDHRFVEGIPAAKVTPVPSAMIMQAAWKAYRGVNRRSRLAMPEPTVDTFIANRAARVSSELPESDLLLYSSFALPAFRSHRTGRKVLFQFHPAPDLIRNVLKRDADRFPHLRFQPEPEVRDWRRQSEERTEEISLADIVVCASSFTNESVKHVNRNAHTAVVPYGATTQLDTSTKAESNSRPQVLFVGQGVQRKGLHHLLTVWPRFRPVANLTLILTNPDPAITAFIPHDVRVLDRVRRVSLTR